MKLVKRKGVWYAHFNAKGHRFRLSTGTDSKPEALRRARELESKAWDEGVPDGRGMTVYQAMDRCFEEYWSEMRSASIIEKLVQQIKGDLGPDLRVSEVTPLVISNYVQRRKAKGDANGTINRKVSYIHKMLTRAARTWLVLRTVPVFERLKEPEGRKRCLTVEEEGAVLSYFQGRRDEHMVDLVVLLADTGLRLGEALRLTPEDVTGRSLRVTKTKTDRTRLVPMTKRVQGILGSRIKKARWFGGRLFPLTKDAVVWRWRQARAGLNLQSDREFVVHSLRHTYASRLVRKGVDLYRVQKLLGHSVIKTTERYAHLEQAQLEAAVEALEQ